MRTEKLWKKEVKLSNNRVKRAFGDGSLIVGKNPVREALSGNRKIEKIYISDRRNLEFSDIERLARAKEVEVLKVPVEKIEDIAGQFNHQGIIAISTSYDYSSLEDILLMSKNKGEDPFIVILDGIEDPHNLGAIARTAECAYADGIIIPKNRSCGITPAALKASAGAIEDIRIARVTNIGRTIEELQKNGIWVAACDMDGESCFLSKALDGPIAIVIGNEGRGVSRLVKEKCDFTVSIPMRGRINSLNASNAAAVVMYEIRRRREQGIR